MYIAYYEVYMKLFTGGLFLNRYLIFWGKVTEQMNLRTNMMGPACPRIFIYKSFLGGCEKIYLEIKKQYKTHKKCNLK
jgi:hypothetical protein